MDVRRCKFLFSFPPTCFIFSATEFLWPTKKTFTTRARSRRCPRWSTSGCARACISGASAAATIPTTAATSCSRRSWTMRLMNTSWATAKRVEIKIGDGRVCVRDFGRGIPLGKVVDCVSKINTGAKYNDDVFQFSVGLNGVGTKAVNALSKTFLVRSHREGEFAEASFKIGKLKKEDSGKTKEANGTLIEFEPDPEIFKESEFRLEHIERRLRHYELSEHRLEAGFENGTGTGRAKNFPVAPRPDGFGHGGHGHRRQRTGSMRRCITRARRWNSVSRTATRATASRFIPSSTANTPATAARI